jgi:hypothetical protein
VLDVEEILPSIGGTLLARTGLGDFLCSGRDIASIQGHQPLALFFPTEAALVHDEKATRSELRPVNEFTVRVESASFIGRHRRIVATSMEGGDGLRLDLECPVERNLKSGDVIKFHVPAKKCRLLIGDRTPGHPRDTAVWDRNNS